MPALAQNVPLKRIRDLLALSRSPNPHEAALARHRAYDLLGKYGLTENDLVEEATSVAYLSVRIEGNQRTELARVVATSRAVTTGYGLNIEFKGFPEAAKDAREL